MNLEQVWTQRAVPDGNDVVAVPDLPEAFMLKGKVSGADTGLPRPSSVPG